MRNALYLAIVLAAAAATGCLAWGGENVNLPHPYEPALHLHNIWHEFLPDGDLGVHFTIVNAGEKEVEYFRIDKDIRLYYPDNDTVVWKARNRDTNRVTEGWLPGTSSEMFWRASPFGFVREERPYHYYVVDADAVGGFGGEVHFRSGCYREGGGVLIRETDGPHETCASRYRVNGEYWIWEEDGRRFVLPTDTQYQELVWSCCRLRSLPAYDAEESWTVPAAGQLHANRSFPVQDGAVNGSVAARVVLPGPSPENGTAGVVARLWVMDPNGTTVADERINGGALGARIDLREFNTTGVYRAFVEASGAPGAAVELEIHVNDGVQPDR